MKNLSVLIGSIRQQALDGELVLEQNDGVRKFYWNRGDLVYLQSEVAGEQFGNYLLRQGILDFPALNELLANDERYRLGEKVVQWGMMTIQERDKHLLSLQEQVMVHALEHAVIQLTWNPGPMAVKLSEDLHFKLEHRDFIWNTFKEVNNLAEISDLLYLEKAWKWEGRVDLLETLADLPLTPTMAYALSFLSTEPISFETFLSLSRLAEDEASRLLVTLWALGALTLTQGDLPVIQPPAAEPTLALDPLELTPTLTLYPPPAPAFTEPPSSDGLQLDLLPLTAQPEFLDLDAPVPPMARPAASTPAAPVTEPAGMDGPTKARKLIIKAKQLLLQDRTVEAIRSLEQSVQLEPEAEGAYGAWLLLGRLRMANPAWSTRSIDALQTASRLKPKAAEPWASMGEVYFRKGFRTNAVACFQRALELDPSVPIPPDVNLQEEEAAGHPSAPTGSLFSRFRSMLGRTDKP